MLALPVKIPRQRLNLINDLSFEWHVRGPPREETPKQRQWRKVWRTVASLEGLKRLRVQIYPFVLYEHEWPDEEKRLLEDARMVTRPIDFELELAWLEGGRSLELPCIVTRILND